jgi:hypothetical protein
MANPFATQIAANPTAVTLHLPATVAAGYAPDDAPNLTPNVPTDSGPKTGLFTRVVDDSLMVEHEAQLTLLLADLPAAKAIPGELKVTVEGTKFVAAKIRKRMWEGNQAAWTLYLQ